MPPESETITVLKLLPVEIVGYVVLAVIILYIARKMYGETAKDKDKILSKYETRLDQVETSLAAITQDNHEKSTQLATAQVELAVIRAELKAARDKEGRCEARMEHLEARYEKRIAELEHEIGVLRAQLGEISEVF